MDSKYLDELIAFEIGCNQYIGSCLMHQKMITQAIESLNNALKLLKDKDINEDNNQMYFIYNTLGYCYNEKKNYPQMIESWEKAKEYLE